MSRSTMTYAVLLLLAMLGSYFAWTDVPSFEDEEGDEAGVVLVKGDEDSFEKLVYTYDDFTATLVRKTDDLGAYVWVETARSLPKDRPSNPHDPHLGMHDDAEDTKDGDKVAKLKFKAGSKGDDLVTGFAPLKAVREIDVPDDRLEEFGLKEPKGSLAVTIDGKVTEFELGAEGYGHRNVYAREKSSKKAYVLAAKLMNPLKRADTRLPEKSLFGLQRSEIGRIAVTTSEQSFELVHNHPSDRAASFWAPPGEDQRNKTAETWLDKVFGLTAAEFLKTELPKESDTAFGFTVHPLDGKPIKVSVLRTQDEKGNPLWVATSSFTRAPVKLNSRSASDAADDLGAVFGALSGEEPAEEPAEKLKVVPPPKPIPPTPNPTSNPAPDK